MGVAIVYDRKRAGARVVRPSPWLDQRLFRELILTTMVTSFVTILTKRVIKDPPFRFV